MQTAHIALLPAPADSCAATRAVCRAGQRRARGRPVTGSSSYPSPRTFVLEFYRAQLPAGRYRRLRFQPALFVPLPLFRLGPLLLPIAFLFWDERFLTVYHLTGCTHYRFWLLEGSNHLPCTGSTRLPAVVPVCLPQLIAVSSPIYFSSGSLRSELTPFCRARPFRRSSVRMPSSTCATAAAGNTCWQEGRCLPRDANLLCCCSWFANLTAACAGTLWVGRTAVQQPGSSLSRMLLLPPGGVLLLCLVLVSNPSDASPLPSAYQDMPVALVSWFSAAAGTACTHPYYPLLIPNLPTSIGFTFTIVWTVPHIPQLLTTCCAAAPPYPWC